MIIDRLYEAVAKKGHVCLGLDTDLDYIPKEFKSSFEDEEDMVFNFNKRIIDSTGDVVACYKPQIAYYEALGLKGLRAYKRTLDYIREKGYIAIGDIKRGDIAKTAEMYAKAHFEGDFEADFITLNPYMGLDTIAPFMPYINNKEKGVFLLIRTSNPGAEDIQYINSDQGERVYEITGQRLNTLAKEAMGNCGYSSIGGVVGCTHIEEGLKLRQQINNMFLLIPGYGAQGGKAQDVALYLKNGNGGVVNSSRGILLAYKKHEHGAERFDEYARAEAIRMRDEIRMNIQ